MVVKRLAQLAVLATMIGGALAARNDTSVGAIPGGGVREVHRPDSSVNGVRQIVTGKQTAPVVVDGSQIPEAISDALAYRLFIQTTLVPEVPSAAEIERQTLRLARIGFQELDREAYVRAVEIARQGFDYIAAQRAIWSTPAAAKTTSRGETLKALKKQEDQIFAETKQRLDTSLTPEGSRRLDRHIRDHVKRRIKIYGSFTR